MYKNCSPPFDSLMNTRNKAPVAQAHDFVEPSFALLSTRAASKLSNLRDISSTNVVCVELITVLTHGEFLNATGAVSCLPSCKEETEPVSSIVWEKRQRW